MTRWEQRSSRDKLFYKQMAWRRLRVVALQRDNCLCQNCLRNKKITIATEVHHKKPIKNYPELSLELSNLESLCWQCHEETKRRREEISYKARVIKI